MDLHRARNTRSFLSLTAFAGLALMALALLVVPSSALADTEAPKDLGKAHEFRLPLYEGGKVTLSKLLEEGPVLLDFWATWCGPCRRALPRYQQLYDRYREKGLRVLAISQDDPRSRAKIGAQVRSMKLSIPVPLDGDKRIARLYRVQSLPTSFLIDTDGRVVYHHIGYRDGDEKILEKKIRGLLGLEEEAPAP